LRAGEREVFVEMKMWNERKDKLKSVLWSNFVHINMKTQKPESHSKELIEMFLPFENPLPSPMSFDERVEQLRNMI
jgi:acyl-CoA thioester hydrolase